MAMSCEAKTLKILVFFFNFLAFLAGLAILVFCILSYVNNPWKDDIYKIIESWSKISNSLNYALFAGMAIGGLVILLGFLGCCGAIAESACLLCAFAVILFILAACQIVGGSLLIAKESWFDNDLKTAISELEARSDMGDKDACDLFKTLSDKSICCHPDSGYCADAWSCKPGIQVCEMVLSDELKTYSKAAGGIVIGIAAFELVAIVFATCLCCSFR